jgi:hypothetical protein
MPVTLLRQSHQFLVAHLLLVSHIVVAANFYAL